MKQLLFILICLLAAGCNKDDDTSARPPNDIYGTYNVTLSRVSPAASYGPQEWEVKSGWIVPINGNPVDSFQVNLTGSNISIPVQTVLYHTAFGGTATVSGNGTYSDGQFTITITRHLVTPGVDVTSIYTATGVKL